MKIISCIFALAKNNPVELVSRNFSSAVFLYPLVNYIKRRQPSPKGGHTPAVLFLANGRRLFFLCAYINDYSQLKYTTMERTITETFTSANILKATISHNGFQGGDAGHGGYVFLKLENEASTSMQVDGRDADEVTLTFTGDTERDTLLRALKMFVFELENYKSI